MKNRLKYIVMAGIFSVHTMASMGMTMAADKSNQVQEADEKKKSENLEVILVAETESENSTEIEVPIDAQTPTEDTEEIIEEELVTEVITDNVPETEAPTESETESQPSTEGTTENTTDSSTETESEIETESESETETESETESEIETESEKETETEVPQEVLDEFAKAIGETMHDFSYYPIGNITDNTNQIYDYLVKEMGLNHAAACGVLANIQCESNFASTAVGDGGTSYGLCQWHLGRFSALVGFCEANGYNFHSIEGQLAYLKYELETGYTGVYEYIKNVPNTAKGAYDAAYYWCVNFEIPSDTHYNGVVRANLAENEFFPRTLGTKEKKKKVRIPKLEKTELAPEDVRVILEKAPESILSLSRLDMTMEEAVWNSVLQ